MKTIAILIILLIAGVVLVTGCTNDTPTETTSEPETSGKGDLTVTDLRITEGEWGDYTLTANLIPDKDYSYLEMMVIVYDSGGAILEQSSLIWNVNNALKGQTYNINRWLYVSGDREPVKVDVFVYDDVFASPGDDNYVFKQTVTVG